MDPVIAQAISTLISAIAVAILAFAAYTWPKGHHNSNAEENEEDTEE